MAGPDLPGPWEPFTVTHLRRWPMGAGRAELVDGHAYWSGDFDERDAMVARRALPGYRIRIEPGAGLLAGPVPEDDPASREWTDADGTRWHEMNGMTLFHVPGGQHWTMRSPTREERRHNHEQLAAYRAQQWAAAVGAYAADPADLLAAWAYLTAQPIFWSYSVPATWQTSTLAMSMNPSGHGSRQRDGCPTATACLTWTSALAARGTGSRSGWSTGPYYGRWMFRLGIGPGSESAAPRRTTRAWTWQSRPGKRRSWRWRRKRASATATTGRGCPSRGLTPTTRRDDPAKPA